MKGALPLLLLLAGCPAGPDGPADLGAGPDLSTGPGAGDQGADQAGDLGPACPTDQIAFTQATGCQNDGSVAFCIPAGDEALKARVAAIAPTVTCRPGGGRARCSFVSELLCTYPTGMAECVAFHGALRDEAWRTVCQLAALPEVRRIVPTWFE